MDQTEEIIIDLVGVSKTYDDTPAVKGIDLYIRKGEFVTLLGPSGCGKTTLLRMIAGFESPTEGEIFIEGEEITSKPPYRRPVNTVFQKYALFPHLNVFNNVAYGLKLKKIPAGEKKGKTVYRHFTKAEIAEKVNRALKLVDLEDYGYRNVNSLSGGQQQRIAIARALVCEPKVLLLDEPLGALDLKMRKEMQIELKRMHRELGITFIYVTHDQEEALTMSDTVVVINDGKIQQIGTPKKIYDEPSNAFVANFIGESNILSGTMIKDYLVKFLGVNLPCLDKGFSKNEQVDIVIRPEDIAISVGGEGQFKGVVTSSVFKGTYYEMNVQTSSYEFTVQNTVEYPVGQEVTLGVVPDSIHIMRKMRTVNAFAGEVEGEDSVCFCDASLPYAVGESFESGESVVVKVPFDAIEITDDENDGTIGAVVAQSVYKGTYYQVQLVTKSGEDFFADTPYEWNIGDRVGIKIDPAKISVEKDEGAEEN
ncbi:MAG: ATP-binding cassette domain-containing protein [Clostridia bacterium]|nr:ATP-binding cassette domain-containing protein [Clostridia bacterium]